MKFSESEPRRQHIAFAQWATLEYGNGDFCAKIAQFPDNFRRPARQFVGLRRPSANRYIPPLLQLTIAYRAMFITPVMSVVAESGPSIYPTPFSPHQISKTPVEIRYKQLAIIAINTPQKGGAITKMPRQITHRSEKQGSIISVET